MSPQEALEDFFKTYLSSVNMPMGKKHEPGKPAGKLQQVADYLASKFPADVRNRIKVKASVGNGVYAQVPWIGFFNTSLTKSATKGYYPVILFKADMSGLYLSFILAAGRTRGAGNSDSLSDLKNRANEFRPNLITLKDSGLASTPPMNLNCKRSSVAVGYEAGSVLHKLYPASTASIDALAKDVLATVQAYLQLTHDIADASEIDRLTNTLAKLYCASSAKPLTILAGGTGTGKTRAAKLVAASIAGPDNVEVVAVGADWTDNRPLLGFRNLLAEGGKTYVAPPALRIILKALDNPGKPYFLILDEMNLSHVERYFADFLSSMESKEPLKLHDSADDLKTEDGIAVKGKVDWPSNLFVIGTVNIDETTYMFSPKVLDRAHVIEFKVSWDEIEGGLDGAVPGELPSLQPAQVDEFMRVAGLKVKTLSDEDHDALVQVLEEMHEVLDGTRFVFAHRTARECLNFIATAKALAAASIVPAQDTKDLIDLAILQKALPKLNGAAGTLSKVLDDLIKVADSHDLNQCKAKLESMSRQLKADQFVSFIQ